MGYFWGRGKDQKVFSSLLMYSIVPSILTIDFDFILGSFLTFWGPNWLLLGLGLGSTTVLVSTHVVEQISFSMFASILNFDFDFILGSFFISWGPNGPLLGLGWGFTTVLGSTRVVEKL